MNRGFLFSLLLAVSLLTAGLAAADCSITGVITAEETNHPLGMWTYTMTVDYLMDSGHGLSHLNLMVDAAGGTCTCDDIGSAVHFDTIAGSMNQDGCEIDFSHELLCDGDPSMGIGGILFKFEPFEAECGEPESMGTITVVFHSDMGPEPIDDEAVTLADKGGLEHCLGSLEGVFPGLDCDPVANQNLPLGSLKGIYR